MRFVLVGCDCWVRERERLLGPVFRRLEVWLDVVVSWCAEWIEEVDF